MSETDIRLRQLHKDNEVLEIALRLRIRATTMRKMAERDDEMAERLEQLGERNTHADAASS